MEREGCRLSTASRRSCSPPACVEKLQAVVEGGACFLNEVEVVLLIFGLGLAEEKALGERKIVVLDSGFERVEVGGFQSDGVEIELRIGSSFGTIKSLHPSVKIRMLAPVEKLGGVPRFVKVDGGNV